MKGKPITIRDLEYYQKNPRELYETCVKLLEIATRLQELKLKKTLSEAEKILRETSRKV
ncbi:MAG TPA: hypothetical protein VJ327_03520 [Patescibacteria group bacterium]|nr:hypothetical protein [Patescibacteria group bacterium]